MVNLRCNWYLDWGRIWDENGEEILSVCLNVSLMFMGKAKEREQFGDSTEVGSVVKESTCNAGDPNLIPESGRSLGGGHNNPLQYSCLENPMDRGAWWSTVHKVTESQTWLKWLSTQTQWKDGFECHRLDETIKSLSDIKVKRLKIWTLEAAVIEV